MTDYNESGLCLTQEPKNPLQVIDSDELTDVRFKPVRWIVEGLIQPGLTVLAGSPKIGKSWLVLQLGMKIAKGEPLWGMPTRSAEVLYIALEDTNIRLQKRVLTVTDTPSSRLYLATACSPLGDELERELGDFIRRHPLTRVIIIDTFQKIRSQVQQMSYSNDYAEVGRLKEIADALEVCLILVHHTRKLSDTDRFNEISGTNGIAGSADTVMVLTKEKRASSDAVLSVTGRDVTDMELKLNMDRKTCLWDCDNVPQQEDGTKSLPEEITALMHMIKSVKAYKGANAALAGVITECIGRAVPPQVLKNYMGRYRYEMEDNGISFYNERTNSERRVMVVYSPERDRYRKDDETVTRDA
jgi:hypothetical protein